MSRISLIEPTALLAYSKASFVRSSEGSYQTGLATLAWAGVNVPRFEDRGDGLGPLLLLEGARQNFLPRSEELDNAAWNLDNSATVTANSDTAPDGVADADRVNHGATVNGGVRSAQFAGTSDNDIAMISAWARILTAGGNSFRVLRRDATVSANVDYLLTPVWTRFSTAVPLLTGATNVDARFYNHTDGLARQVFVWGTQFEVSASQSFPSSYIRTAAAAVTRQPDSVSWAAGDVANRLRVGPRWAITFAPYFAHNEEPNIVVLVSMDGSVNNSVWYNGSTDRFEVLQGGAAKVSSNVVTFSRHQCLTIIVDPVAGTIEVQGATTGNGLVAGTPWTWASGTVYIGAAGATNHAFGRYSLPRVA